MFRIPKCYFCPHWKELEEWGAVLTSPPLNDEDEIGAAFVVDVGKIHICSTCYSKIISPKGVEAIRSL